MSEDTPTESNPAEADRVQSFFERLARTRNARKRSAAMIADAIAWLLDELERVEDEADQLIDDFNQPSRFRGRKRVIVRWGYRRNDATPIWPYGPYWYEMPVQVPRSEQRPVRIRPPGKKKIERRFKREMVPYQYQIARRIRALTTAHGHLKAVLQQVVAAVDVDGHPSEDRADEEDSARTAWPLRDVQHARRARIAVLEDRVMEAADELDRLDSELDGLMDELNATGGMNRNGSIICRWELRGTMKEQVTGPTGPTFYTLSWQRGHRQLLRVRTGGGPNFPARNRVTKKLLRQCYLRRYQDRYLDLARRIESKRAQRDERTEMLQRCARALRPVTRLKGGSDE